MSANLKASHPLASLTPKQRQALDLLIQHKTSKQISRELGISPHTVDQRIDSARRTLGSATRGELAQTYVMLLKTSERLTYEELVIAEPALSPQSSVADRAAAGVPLMDRNWTNQSTTDPGAAGYRVGPELFSGRGGTIFRISAIMLIALLVVMTLLAAMSMFVEMSKILS